LRDPEPNVERAVPFLRVTAMVPSLAFYVDGLGFRVTRRWEDGGELRWCWLELGAAALMLQTLEDKSPARHEPRTLGEGVRICFMCRDALAVHRDTTARGIHAKEPFVGNALWVVSFVDPDGYAIDFESPTSVAEDTTLSEWEPGAV
jgi:lactoylglutathione lyase